VDLVHPVSALIPGARGKVLTVLLDAGRELSTVQTGRLAGVSTPQASRVLAQLRELGLVERREVPPSVLYKVVAGSRVVRLLRELRSLREDVLSMATELSTSIVPPPVHLAVFGSVATGRAGSESDIDVLVVRPTKADHDDAWTESLDRFRSDLSEYAGSAVEMLEISRHEWSRRDVSEPLWASIEREQIVLRAATKKVRA
jgi:predicted nucleotidyltransferase/DNA-binding transcriptional ArsR family regulator